MKDRSIMRLREIHEQIDSAAIAAYGWDDDPAETTDEMILERLLRMNELRVGVDKRRHAQTLNHLTLSQVRVHNFVNVVCIDIRVPDVFRVHHRNRATGAAVQASGFVDTHFADACQASGLDLRFAAVKTSLGLVLGTAVFAVFTLVETKEDMSLVVGFGQRWR